MDGDDADDAVPTKGIEDRQQRQLNNKTSKSAS